VVFAGFGKSGPFVATVSNQQDEQGNVFEIPKSRFRVSAMLRNEKPMRRLDFVFHGAAAALDSDLVRAIAKSRSALFRKSGARIASAIVAIVRRAAKHPKHGHLISPH
jgi:hypothetical protein